MGYFSYTKEIGIWDNMDYLDTRVFLILSLALFTSSIGEKWTPAPIARNSSS